MSNDMAPLDDWIPDGREHRVIPRESHRQGSRPAGNEMEDGLQAIRMIDLWVDKLKKAQTGPIPAWLVGLEQIVRDGMEWYGDDKSS